MSSQSTDDTPEELRMLWATSSAELAFFKGQQWRVANYALLLYAGLVGVGQLLQPLDACRRVILGVVATLVVSGGVYALVLIQNTIADVRERMTRVRQSFSGSFLDALKPKPTSREPVPVYTILLAVVVLGFLIEIWLLLSAFPASSQATGRTNSRLQQTGALHPHPLHHRCAAVPELRSGRRSRAIITVAVAPAAEPQDR